MAKGLPKSRDYIAVAFKTLRAQYGMTQEDLAMAARTTVQSISTIERGNGNPVLTNLERMAAALKTTVPALILLGEELTMEQAPTLREIFAANVKRARLDQQISQQDLASRASVTVSYLSKLERGLLSPTVDGIEKIARGLKIHPARFFEYDG